MLNVYNVLGEKVASLIDQNLESGTYSLKFDAGHLPTGTYFYDIQINNFSATKRMNLIR